MTPETPAQPPAAPESEVRLTEAEREALEDAVHYPEENVAASFDCACEPVYAAVERIVAERVRVVEGERDAAREARDHQWSERRRHFARAESAEAAHEALREGIEALAEKWDRGGVSHDLRALLAGGES